MLLCSRTLRSRGSKSMAPRLLKPNSDSLAASHPDPKPMIHSRTPANSSNSTWQGPELAITSRTPCRPRPEDPTPSSPSPAQALATVRESSCGHEVKVGMKVGRRVPQSLSVLRRPYRNDVQGTRKRSALVITTVMSSIRKNRGNSDKKCVHWRTMLLTTEPT